MISVILYQSDVDDLLAFGGREALTFAVAVLGGFSERFTARLLETMDKSAG